MSQYARMHARTHSLTHAHTHAHTHAPTSARTRFATVWAVAVLSIVPIALVAQAPKPTGTPQLFVPWANKLFQPTNTPPVILHDFGSVPHGTLLTHRLRITNIYDTPLQIIDIRKSCTCLEAIPPQHVLQPHETAELILTMNTAKFNGPNSQTFYVTFGPQYMSSAVITVKANSRSDVQLNPTNVNFGVVSQGSKPSQTVVVRYLGKQPNWRVIEVVPPTGPLAVQLSQNGNEFLVNVQLKETANASTLIEQISLKTNDPSAPVLQFNVAASIQSTITVAPNAIRFEKVKLGDEQTQKVILRSTKPFKVEPIADSGDGLRVETFPAAAPVQILTVKFKPVGIGNWKHDLTLQTDNGPATLSVDLEAIP
jgi:Protein of unknown function (DUF1573)